MSPAGRAAAGSRKLASPAGETLAVRLEELADQVNRLRESRRDPEAFHVTRNAIAVELLRLAKRLRGEPGRIPTTTWRPG